jgi:hypothetical protein
VIPDYGELPLLCKASRARKPSQMHPWDKTISIRTSGSFIGIFEAVPHAPSLWQVSAHPEIRENQGFAPVKSVAVSGSESASAFRNPLAIANPDTDSDSEADDH